MVRGCTESLALVKSAMSFRGPPLVRCCRWYFFSSDRGRKRFVILWYWTSTWERRRQDQPSCLIVISNCIFKSWISLPCSTWGCLVYWLHQNEHLSYQTECGPHKLPSQSRKRKYSLISCLSAALFKSLQHYPQRWTATYLHDSCYSRFLAVAVVKESRLTFFHLPHKIACL